MHQVHYVVLKLSCIHGEAECNVIGVRLSKDEAESLYERSKEELKRNMEEINSGEFEPIFYLKSNAPLYTKYETEDGDTITLLFHTVAEEINTTPAGKIPNCS